MKLIFALALLAIAEAAMQPVSVMAQAALDHDVEKEIATLRRLLAQVEEQRWVLIPSRGSMVAISPDQAAELFVLALAEGRMGLDEVESRAQLLRAATRERLVHVKQQLAELESGRWPAGRGPEGSWYLNCSGNFPATIRGKVTSLGVNTDGRFGFAMMIEPRPGAGEFVWVAPSGRIGTNYKAEGEVRWVHLSRYGDWGANRNIEANLRWDAAIVLVQRSSAPNRVDGVIHGAGSLALTDDPAGSCTGWWSSP